MPKGIAEKEMIKISNKVVCGGNENSKQDHKNLCSCSLFFKMVMPDSP